MYSKILLAVIIAVLGIFVYLHTQNPSDVTFVVTTGRTYVLPVTFLVFVSFLCGAALALINSLLIDAKRAIKDVKERRRRQSQAEIEDSYRKGLEALAIGDTVSARSLLEKASEARPSDAGMVISLSDTYMREGRARDALRVLEAGVVNSPDSTGILSAIGSCALDAGDEAKASRAFKSVIEADPKNLYAIKKTRDILVRQGKWHEAALLQKKIIEADGDGEAKDREKRLLTGVLFESAAKAAGEGRLPDATVRFKEVLKNDPDFMPAHILLGSVLYSQGNVPNAIRVWEKALVKYPRAVPILLKLEDAYLRASEPDRILEKYKREINSSPDDVNLRLLLARLQLRLEMIDNAIEELERLQHEGEDSFYAQVLLGEAYLRRKQGGRAAHLFEKALGLDRELLPPFGCGRCANHSRAWHPRCPVCGEWNSLKMSPRASCFSFKPAAKDAGSALL